MHIAVKTGVALFALTAVAYAGDDPYVDYYSNTMVMTTAKNIVTRVLANKDGTWTSTSTDPKNPTGSGTWAIVGGWTCVSDAAMPKQKPNCFETVGHKVGDNWTNVEADKSVTKLSLVSGR